MNDRVPEESVGRQKLDFMRVDLRESLRDSNLDPGKLAPFQRILLTTDGTVTEILEAQLYEGMRVVKLDQRIVEVSESVPHLTWMAKRP